MLAGITEGGDTTPVLTTPAPAPPIVRTAGVHEDVQETVQASSNGGAPHTTMASTSDGVEQVEQVQGPVSLKTRCETRLTSSKTVRCIDR